MGADDIFKQCDILHKQNKHNNNNLSGVFPNEFRYNMVPQY